MTTLLRNWIDWLAELPRVRTRKLAFDVARELFLPALLHLRLDRHRLQGFDASQALDEERLVFRTTIELLFEAAPEDRRQDH